MLGEENFNERNIRVSLLVHECFSMIGIPKRSNTNSSFDLIKKVGEILVQEQSHDPFRTTDYEVNEESIEFQDQILAQEVLDPKNSHQNSEEEKFLDLPIEIDDHVCNKVLAANGNLSLNFYSLILLKLVDSEFSAKKSDIKSYEFLQFFSQYLLTPPEELKTEFSQKDYDHFVNYFAYLDEDEEPSNEEMLQELAELQNDVCEIILGSIIKGKDLAESLLIQLVGHENATVRHCAIKYLNCLYDGNIWKLEMPMNSEVKVTGDECVISFTPTISSASYYLGISFPNGGRTCISWHRIPERAQVGKELRFNLGRFEE
jgi:hypothetical protein